MKQSLQLKVSQHLTLTPQLQQSIRLLQLSTLELHQELETFLQTNPMLESGDGDDGGGAEPPETIAITAEDHAPSPEPETHAEPTDFGDQLDWGHGAARQSDDDEDFDPRAQMCKVLTLREHLLAQVSEHALSTRDRAVVTLLIEALDDDGYLIESLEDIAAQFPSELELEVSELKVGLSLLQQFDPAGVGARDLAESMCLQLRARPVSAVQQLALRLADQHLTLLANRDFARLKRILDCDESLLRQAQQLLATLNPRPSSGFGGGETQYVAADVLVVRTRQGWQARLNPAAMPKLRVNSMYANLLQQHREGGSQLNAQLQEARWLVRNIRQRFDTILRVSDAIVARQQAFFELGDEGMKPMVLRDIAEELGLHESTISRVTTQKYLMSPRGLFELKYFFGSGLEGQNGSECSATAIKARIRKLIQMENSKKPLSDNALAENLAAEGIQVARRTVAKYREAMQIPAASLRKVI